MTKTELKIVLKLIDNNTTKYREFDDQEYCYYDALSMNNEQITKLKEDLEEIFNQE